MPQYVFEIKDALPRAAFYENIITVTNNNEALDYISDKKFDIQKYAVANIAEKDQIISTNRRYSKANIMEYKPMYAKIEVTASNRGLLVYNIKNDPSWSVKVDGQPSKIVAADYILQGVMLDAGKHTVEFQYRSDEKLFFVSLLTVLAALLISVVYGVVLLFTGPKKQQA